MSATGELAGTGRVDRVQQERRGGAGERGAARKVEGYGPDSANGFTSKVAAGNGVFVFVLVTGHWNPS